MAAASVSLGYSPSPAPPCSPLFTPIPEQEREEEEEEPAAATNATAYRHRPTPLHHPNSRSNQTGTKKAGGAKSKGSGLDADDCSVSCNKCRPSANDKTSVVPLDASGLSPASNGVLRSLFLSLTRRSPRSSVSASSAATSAREEEWRLAAAELSRKLVHATRKRDEAVLEASRLKHSVAELERKLDRLESYCRDLKSALDRCAPSPAQAHPQSTNRPPGSVGALPVEPFLRAVSEARSGVRNLGRALAAQIRHGAGPKALDRVAALLQPFDVRAAQCRNPRSLLFYLEALLNRVFFSDFEAGFGSEESGILDPAARCEASRASYEAVRAVTWEEVLSRGTRHYSEGLSRFCDRCMGEVVGMLGWARAWPEGLLQAFFGAAKGVWLVHLLACSVHPAVPLLRVEPAARFDPGYMEDVAADRVTRLTPASVKMMVAPGFYVYSTSCGVVKSKVICVYMGNGANGSRIHGHANNDDTAVTEQRQPDGPVGLSLCNTSGAI